MALLAVHLCRCNQYVWRSGSARQRTGSQLRRCAQGLAGPCRKARTLHQLSARVVEDHRQRRVTVSQERNAQARLSLRVGKALRRSALQRRRRAARSFSVGPTPSEDQEALRRRQGMSYTAVQSGYRGCVRGMSERKRARSNALSQEALKRSFGQLRPALVQQRCVAPRHTQCTGQEVHLPPSRHRGCCIATKRTRAHKPPVLCLPSYERRTSRACSMIDGFSIDWGGSNSRSRVDGRNRGPHGVGGRSTPNSRSKHTNAMREFTNALDALSRSLSAFLQSAILGRGDPNMRPCPNLRPSFLCLPGRFSLLAVLSLHKWAT